MSSNRNPPSRPEDSRGPPRSPRQDQQRSSSVSSWFSRTFLPSSGPPTGPSTRPTASQTTRQRQVALEQSLRGQISLPTELPRARRSPSNRNSPPVDSHGGDFSYPPGFFITPRAAPSPPSQRMVSTPPQRSRLPTYGGRPVGSHGSTPSPPPNRPLPAIPSRRDAYIPPAREIQVPPGESSQDSGSRMNRLPVRGSPISPSGLKPKGMRSTIPKPPHAMQQEISNTVSPVRDPHSSPPSNNRTPNAASKREYQIRDTAASTGTVASLSPASVQPLAYSPKRKMSSILEEIQTSSPPPHKAEVSSQSFVPESSSRFVTPPPARDPHAMSPTESSAQASELGSILELFPLPPTYTSWDPPRHLHVNTPSPARGSRKPSPKPPSGTRSSTPSRGRALDFALETPEQRGARHAANQAVYDRMNPVLRRARSGFDLVRDWVAENSGVTSENDDIKPVLVKEPVEEPQQSEKVEEEKPKATTSIVESGDSVTEIPQLSPSNHSDEHRDDFHTDVPMDAGIEHPFPESVEASVPDVSTLTIKSDISITSSNAAAGVVRRLRKKNSFYNLRAPEPMLAIVRVTDEDFYEEVPTRLLEAIAPAVNAFVKMGPPPSYSSDEEEDAIEYSTGLPRFEEIEEEGEDLYIPALPSSGSDGPVSQEDYLDDSQAPFVNVVSPVSTPQDEKEAFTESSITLAPTEEAADEHSPVQASPDHLLTTQQDSITRPVHPIDRPFNPHPEGAEAAHGGPLVIIPRPTTADGYLNIQAFWTNGEPMRRLIENVDVEKCYKTPWQGWPEQQQQLAGTADTPSPSDSPSPPRTVERQEPDKEREAEESDGRQSGQSSRSTSSSGIVRSEDTMCEWLLSIAIVDEKGGIWIPPVDAQKEFEVVEKYDNLIRLSGPGEARYVRVGSGAMVLSDEDDEIIKGHLLPLRCKKVAAEEVERERRALLKRWVDSDITILEIPVPVLKGLWDQERGKLRSVTDLDQEEVDQIVRETRKSAEGDAMDRVKLDAMTDGSSRWLRMSPHAKRQLVEFNLTGWRGRSVRKGVEDDLAREIATQGKGKRKYRARRRSETFVVFEARRKKENHENAPPVLGTAVGRPKPRKTSFLTRCREAVQGFFRAAVALSSQPKPKTTSTSAEVKYTVVRSGRGLHKVKRVESSVIVQQSSPREETADFTSRGKQRTHRRKRSVVKGFFSPILLSKKDAPVVGNSHASSFGYDKCVSLEIARRA
ncbi:hypothetical protein TWF281_004869 [Arthrobotrys megalospora]